MHIITSYKPILAASLLALGLAGCNTVSGAGKDIASIGNMITGGADQTQQYVFGSNEEGSSAPSSAPSVSENTAPSGQTTNPDMQSNSTGLYAPPSAPDNSQSASTQNSSTGQNLNGQNTVYFDSGSAQLSSEARDALRQAVAQQSFHSTTRVRVMGFTDTQGATDANEQLSQRRAEAVAGELSALGVPRNMLDVSWYGEDQVAIATGDNVSEAENRRVTIDFSPSVAQAQ